MICLRCLQRPLECPPEADRSLEAPDLSRKHPHTSTDLDDKALPNLGAASPPGNGRQGLQVAESHSGGAPAPWIRVGVPIGEAGRGPSESRWDRGIRSPWASWALIVRGDAGDLKTTFLLTTTHGPWGSGLGSGGGGAGLLERGSGTSGTRGPHGRDIGAPGDVWVRHGRRALWELGGAWLVTGVQRGGGRRGGRGRFFLLLSPLKPQS